MKTILHQLAIAKKLANESANSPTYCAVGTGVPVVSRSSTGLTTETVRGLFTQSYSDVVTTNVYVLTPVLGNGVITEIGAFDAN